MIVTRCFLVLGMIALGLHPTSARAQTAPVHDAAARCAALAIVDFSRIPDALTEIMEAKVVEPTRDTAGYCEVRGYVAPNVGFLFRLPLTTWNGKFIQIGCGGFCGTLEHISACKDPLRRGYACIVSDGGHRARSGEAKWAYNNLAGKIDLFIRAPHVTALVGKAILERFYGQRPRKCYFMGCSGGGSQAMQMAQRFPWDFDGIIAGSALSWAGNEIKLLWNNRVLTDKAGQPVLRQGDLDLINQAVVRRCDLNDGIKDGLIGDPRECDFDPSTVLCAANRQSQCLTANQVEAVRKIYGGPVTSKGEQVFLAGPSKGSERQWLHWFYGDPVTSTETPSAVSGGTWPPRSMYGLIGEMFRYLNIFYPDPGPTWKPEDFDFDRDYKRVTMMENLLEPLNPDLRRFNAAGGKLLHYIGWDDVIAVPLADTDYYDTVEKLMGGRTVTQNFYRLFAISGAEHCPGNGGAWAVDWLSYLEAWVEKGQAPDKLVASYVAAEDGQRVKSSLDPAKIKFSRPVYPYPTRTKYVGRGDPRDAANFGPEE